MIPMTCPFCEALRGNGLLVDAEEAASLLDKHPVSPGHSLVVPRRHIESFWELSPAELSSVFEVVAETRSVLDAKFDPDGYNLGVNIGEAAGQTIKHLHVHLIPRYWGDDVDPRGGVRWILPERAVYWED